MNSAKKECKKVFKNESFILTCTYASPIYFHKQQYRFSMYLFSTMVNARTLADLVSRVRLIKLLLCSKVQSQSMRHAHDALVDIINGLDDIEDNK